MSVLQRVETDKQLLRSYLCMMLEILNQFFGEPGVSIFNLWIYIKTASVDAHSVAADDFSRW